MGKQMILNSEVQINVGKVLYTGKVNTSGGRDGYAVSEDKKLNITLSPPGSTGTGTNPEQLFAAGWSACFIGAMKHNATHLKLSLPDDISVDTEVDLTSGENGFNLEARLTVNLLGVTIDDANKIVAAAHETCPYSKATCGNINVTISVNV